jgi:hypothetical protein
VLAIMQAGGYKNMQTLKKKGIQLNQAFGAVLTLVLVAVLVIIAIYLFHALSGSFDTASAEANATNTMITQFAAYPALIGLVGTIIFLGIVIGVLVASFVFGGKQKA